MKKVLLLAMMCVLGLFTVKAQETSFSYNFDDGALTGWRTFTGEGNVGNGWGISPVLPSYAAAYQPYYFGTDESNCLVSMSYDLAGGSMYKPHAYIVTEAAYKVTSNSVLTWIVKAPFSSGEYYEVVVSEDNTNFEAIYSNTIINKSTLETITLNIAEVAADKVGKSLYIGFRHYRDYTSSNASHICIDDVVLTGTEEAPAPVAPEAPVVTAKAEGETTIVLSWEAVETATSYNVYSVTTEVVEEESTDKYELVKSGVTELTYTVEGLTAATEYSYAVTALNGELESEKSAKATATTAAPEVPETPEIPAEDSIYMICERFENYAIGDKLAEKGNDCWSTWSGVEGGKEEGFVDTLDGNKVAHFKYGNDQVIFLGDHVLGCYEIKFDVYVPNGKSGYYNILHDFAGSSSTWAMQGYLQMTDDGGQTQVQAPGHGTIHAGGNSVADLACVYDAWMHFRFVIDIDRDSAAFYCTMPTDSVESTTPVVEWQWSKGSFDDDGSLTRKLDAMNFYPPLKTSEFYLDNFTFRKTSGETAPKVTLDEEIRQWSMADDIASIEVTFENTGTSIADYTAWIDYGVGQGGSKVEFINYDADINENSTVLGLNFQEPSIIELGAMYPASAYASSVAGTMITHVSYPFAEIEEGAGFGIVEGSDVVFRIYGQGYNGQPGECLSEKAVPYSEITGGWVTAKLDEPVALSGFNVWATVSLLQPVSTQAKPAFPMVFDGMPENLAPYGDVIRVGNEGPFYFAHELFSQPYGNVHIRISCSGDPVLGGWAELESVDGILPIGETATTINFNTFGLEVGKTYEAKVVVAVNNVDELFETPLLLQICGENVDEILSNNYNIYPNPTTGVVTVEGENINFVSVYNSLGQLVKVVKTQNNVVDMSAYDNGVYFFNVVDNAGQSSVQRVVVAK